MPMNVLMSPTLRVGQGTHLGGLSVFPSLAGAPLGDRLGADAGAGHALASRSPHHEIRGLGWDDEVLHATVFNRRHHLMELA